MKNLKSIIWFVIIAIVAVVAFVKQDEIERLHAELIDTNQAYEQLSDHAAELEIKYEDQKRLKEKLEKDFAAEKQALKGRIKVLSNATFLIREKARRNGKSDLIYSGEKFGYLLNEIRFNEGPPVGYVLIFDDGRVTSKLYNHVIDVKTAISREEESGRYHIVSKADYILKSPSLNVNGEKVWTNKPYPLKIQGGTAAIDPTEPVNVDPKFHWNVVRANANLNYKGYLAGGLGVSFMGYGPSKRDLDWRFLQVGFDNTQESFNFTFVPALYRPLKNRFPNTYVGIGIDTQSNYLMNFAVGF